MQLQRADIERLLAASQAAQTRPVPTVSVAPIAKSKSSQSIQAKSAERQETSCQEKSGVEPLFEGNTSLDSKHPDPPIHLFIGSAFACCQHFPSVRPVGEGPESTCLGHNFFPDGGAAVAVGDPGSDIPGPVGACARAAASPAAAAASPSRVHSPLCGATCCVGADAVSQGVMLTTPQCLPLGGGCTQVDIGEPPPDHDHHHHHP